MNKHSDHPRILVLQCQKNNLIINSLRMITNNLTAYSKICF